MSSAIAPFSVILPVLFVQGLAYAALLVTMKFLFTELRVPYPLFVTTVNSLGGFVVVLAKCAASLCVVDPAGAGKRSVHGRPTQDEPGATAGAPAPEEKQVRAALERLSLLGGILIGFSYAGMNLALHMLDSVSFGMLAKNVLLMDLAVFFLLDWFAGSAKAEDGQKRCTSAGFEQHGHVDQLQMATAQRPGTPPDQPVHDTMMYYFRKRSKNLPTGWDEADSTDVPETQGEETATQEEQTEASTQEEATKTCAFSRVSGGAFRGRLLSAAEAKAKASAVAKTKEKTMNDGGITSVRESVCPPVDQSTTTTTETAARSTSAAVIEQRFLFPWDRLQAPIRFFMQVGVICLGASSSVVLATRGHDNTAGTMGSSRSSSDTVAGVLVLLGALLLGSTKTAIQLYCTSPTVGTAPRYLRRLVFVGSAEEDARPAAAKSSEKQKSLHPSISISTFPRRADDLALEKRSVVGTEGSGPVKISALECSTRMLGAQFLTLCVLAICAEGGLDVPLRHIFLGGETQVSVIMTLLGFCSLLGLAVSTMFGQLAKLAGPVSTGCLRYVSFCALAVSSAVVLRASMTLGQIACSALMLGGALSIASDAASEKGLFLKDDKEGRVDAGDRNKAEKLVVVPIQDHNRGTDAEAGEIRREEAQFGSDHEDEPLERTKTDDRRTQSLAAPRMSLGDWAMVFLAGVIAVVNLGYLVSVRDVLAVARATTKKRVHTAAQLAKKVRTRTHPGFAARFHERGHENTATPSSEVPVGVGQSMSLSDGEGTTSSVTTLKWPAPEQPILDAVYGRGKYGWSPKYVDLVQLLRDFHRFTMIPEIFGSRGSLYSIAAGTALGYYRHPQFLIPYDDDNDVVVPASFWANVLQFALDRGLGSVVLDERKRTSRLEASAAETPSNTDAVNRKRKMWVLAHIPRAASFGAEETGSVGGEKKSDTVAIVYQSRSLASADAIFEATGATYVLVVANELVKDFARELKGEENFAAGDLDEARWAAWDGKHNTNIMATLEGGRFFMRHNFENSFGLSDSSSDPNGRSSDWSLRSVGPHGGPPSKDCQEHGAMDEKRNYRSTYGGPWYTQLDLDAYFEMGLSRGDSLKAGLLSDANFPETELVEYAGVTTRVFSSSAMRPGDGGRRNKRKHLLARRMKENVLKRYLQTKYGENLMPPKNVNGMPVRSSYHGSVTECCT